MPLIEAPMPGTLLAGKYLVEGMLGAGGMGVVLAAHHQQLDQRVAIKLLLKEARNHPEVVERFAREARAAAKIRGDHVARVIDVGVLDDGAPFMVMEYLDGRDLAAELRARGTLPADEVTQWILEACEAIAQAHAARIVHRDLKPGNMFLARQPDGHSIVKVLDFGISKTVDPGAPALTKTSSLVGTPYYMAPEQLTAAKFVDTRADIWALGVIMYELLAGRPPFDGEQMPEVVAAILSNQPAPLDIARPDVPPGLVQAIARCMKTKPDDRYQTVAGVAAAIAPFASTQDPRRTQRIARVLGVSQPLSETLTPDTVPAPVVAGGPDAKPPRAADFAIDKTVRLEDVADASAADAGSAASSAASTSSAPPGPSDLATTAVAPSTPPQTDPSAARSIVGVASAAPAVAPKRPIALLGAIAVGAIAIGAGAMTMLGGDSRPGPARIVATTSSLDAPPIVSAPASSAAPESPPTIPTDALTASAPRPVSSVVPSVRPSTAPTIAHAAAAPRPSARPSSPPPSDSAKTPAASPSKNPFDMGIK